MRLLLVDDDQGFRTLLRTTFEAVAVEVSEAGSAAQATLAIRNERPDVVVLDVGMPVTDGITFCRTLKADPETRDLGVVLLTGRDDVDDLGGADAILLKPFRPLELLAVVERVAGGHRTQVPRVAQPQSGEEQLLLYARDLRDVMELERSQRSLLESAYLQTVSALTSALETKDTRTRQHSQRVQRYAIELARVVDPELASDQSAEYGFLLHDIGKIGIPDQILGKPSALNEVEWRLMKSHTVLGAQMLGGIAFLDGLGVGIVRSHHERWAGGGYPDGLAGEEIPIGARIFAVADALDAITNHRPYRDAQSWRAAHREILIESGKQFDPDVVDAFRDREHVLHEIRREFLAAA
ncbi:MAG: response regulator [Actinobacteria bacterium]|nr:response regulator [Actinomycetota bacterium]